MTKFVEKLYEAGVHPERSVYNFGIGDEGDIIYVEPFPAFYFSKSKSRWVLAFSPTKIKLAIAGLKDDETRSSAQQYLERIFQLFAEEKEKVAPDSD